MKDVGTDYIEEMFSKFESVFSKRDIFGTKNQPPILHIIEPWKIGIQFQASPAWRLFRARAKRGDRLKVFIITCQMLLSGYYSMREVSRKTGYSINTVMLLMSKLRAFKEKQGLGEIKCPCGKIIVDHRGWCSYRYNKSEKRKVFINNWNLRKTFIKNWRSKRNGESRNN